MKGIGAYLYLKENKGEEALKIVPADSEHTHNILLRAHILLSLKKTQDAWTYLVDRMNESMLKSLDWLLFMAKTLVSQK